MRDHSLLLERRLKKPLEARPHEGRITMPASDTRWCSDGFEFRFADGTKLSVTFVLNCCDRKAIGWAASPSWAYTAEQTRLFAPHIGSQPLPPVRPAEQRHRRKFREDDQA